FAAVVEGCRDQSRFQFTFGVSGGAGTEFSGIPEHLSARHCVSPLPRWAVCWIDGTRSGTTNDFGKEITVGAVRNLRDGFRILGLQNSGCVPEIPNYGLEPARVC